MPLWAIPRDGPNYSGRKGVPAPKPVPKLPNIGIEELFDPLSPQRRALTAEQEAQWQAAQLDQAEVLGIDTDDLNLGVDPGPNQLDNSVLMDQIFSDAPVQEQTIAVQPGMQEPEKSDVQEALEVAGDIGKALGLLPGPNFRAGAGITNRDDQIMTWRLPNGSAVQMYINPENFQVAESKQVTPTRTKGGFVVQYWGENLTRISLSGTTGSAGVKGIHVLRDVYRSENLGFELVAKTQMQDIMKQIQQQGTALEDASLAQIFSGFSESLRDNNFIMRPSLAALSLSILLFYQGVVYRGFFTEFSVTESTTKLGLFDYNIAFTVTETRGVRKNFMAWHKEPLGDSLVGQLISGALNEVGNAVSSALGLPQSAQNPKQFHPESADLSFGGTIFNLF